MATLAISSTGCKKSDPSHVQNPGSKGKPGEVNKWGGVWKNFTIHPNSGYWYYDKPASGDVSNAPKGFLVYIDEFAQDSFLITKKTFKKDTTYMYYSEPIYYVHMEDGSPAFNPFTGEQFKLIYLVYGESSFPEIFLKELKAGHRIPVSVYHEYNRCLGSIHDLINY